MNQKGNIFPLTMMISFLFLAVFFHQLEAYKVEQQFMKEREEIEKLQSLSQIAFVDIAHELQTLMLPLPYQGEKVYPHGTVDIDILQVDSSKVAITLFASTREERKNNVKILYNIEANQVENWIEW